MSEELGKAHVQITADTSGAGGLDQGLDKAEKRVDSWGKRIKRSIGNTIGPAAAVYGALNTINRVVEAWRAYSTAAADVGDENRKIQESITGGDGLGTALTQLEEDITRVEKAYAAATAAIASNQERRETKDIIADKMVQGVWRVSQAWALFDAARKKDVQALARAVTDAASSEEGNYNARAQQEAADSAKRQAEAKALARELNRIEEQANTAGLSEFFKIEYEKQRLIKQVHDYEVELGDDVAQKSIANIEKVFKARQQKFIDQINKEMEEEKKRAKALADAITSAIEGVTAKQRDLFGVQDLKAHISRVGDLLAKLAQQYRGK